MFSTKTHVDCKTFTCQITIVVMVNTFSRLNNPQSPSTLTSHELITICERQEHQIRKTDQTNIGISLLINHEASGALRADPPLVPYDKQYIALLVLGFVVGVGYNGFYYVYTRLVTNFFVDTGTNGLSALLAILVKAFGLISVVFGIAIDRFRGSQNQVINYVSRGYTILAGILLLQGVLLLSAGKNSDITTWCTTGIFILMSLAHIAYSLAFISSITLVVEYSHRERLMARGQLLGNFLTLEFIGIWFVSLAVGFLLPARYNFDDIHEKQQQDPKGPHTMSITYYAFTLGFVFLIPYIYSRRQLQNKNDQTNLNAFAATPVIPVDPQNSIQQLGSICQRKSVLQYITVLLIAATGLGPSFIDENVENGLAIWSDLSPLDVDRISVIRILVMIFMTVFWTKFCTNSSWRKLLWVWMASHIMPFDLLATLFANDITRSPVTYIIMVSIRTACRSWEDILVISLAIEIAKPGIEGGIVGLIFSVIGLGHFTSSSLKKLTPKLFSVATLVNISNFKANNDVAYQSVTFWAIAYSTVVILTTIIVFLLLPSQKLQAQYDLNAVNNQNLLRRNILVIILIILLLGNLCVMSMG